MSVVVEPSTDAFSEACGVSGAFVVSSEAVSFDDDGIGEFSSSFSSSDTETAATDKRTVDKGKKCFIIEC